MKRCIAYMAAMVLLVNIVCCKHVTLQDRSGDSVFAVRGIVTDEEGEPVEDATVRVCGYHFFRDGQWSRFMGTGRMPGYSTDGHGRFIVPLNESSRLDLWFYKPGFAPTFLYDVSASSEELKVVIGRGLPVVGTVTRRVGVEGILQPVRGAEVQLKSPYIDLWYQQGAFTDEEGIYTLRVPHPPTDRKWYVVCPGCSEKGALLNVEGSRPMIDGPDFVL